MSVLYPPSAAGESSEEKPDGSSISSYDDRYPYQQNVVDHALALLNVVYGEVNSEDFPLPLETFEAGICKNGQRRYLFTDAFGVMAYQTLSEYYMNKEDLPRANLYRRAVERLIHVVHDSLGKPRNRGPTSKMKECDISPTGYVGVRIGKPSSKKITDHGTRWDGLFWNHIDKWLFALVRAGHIDDGIRIAKSCFPSFFYEPMRDPNFGRVIQKGGMHHKLSVDGTPPPLEWDSPLENSYDDTFNAYVVFQMLESKNEHHVNSISLQSEINKLRGVLRNSYSWEDFQPNKPDLRCTRDPIEWGMTAIFDQFVASHPRTSSHDFQLGNQRHIIGSSYHSGSPWLAYAELMGASVYDSVLSEQDVEDLLNYWTNRQPVGYYYMGGHPQESDRKAGMQRVMLAMALLSPGVLKRREDDIMVGI